MVRKGVQITLTPDRMSLAIKPGKGSTSLLPTWGQVWLVGEDDICSTTSSENKLVLKCS